mgnify:CR=1 FL=1
MIKGFIILLQFMTRIPIPLKVEYDEEKLGKSIKYFFDNINDLEINDLLNTMYKLLSYQIEGKKIDSETWDSFYKKF